MITQRLPKLLFVDDDHNLLEQIPEIFLGEFETDVFPTIEQGLAAIFSNFYDIILLDLNFENEVRTGLDVFRKIQSLDRGADVIVISGESNPRRLIEVFNSGVTQFIPKPAEANEIRSAVRYVLKQRMLRAKALELTLGTDSAISNGIPLIGSSPAMIRLKEEINRVISSGVKDILITGETGTGKEVIAKFIATRLDSSLRFFPVNCAALNENLIQSELFGHMKGSFTGADRDKIGVFEAAAGGFVFLDEIGDMPLSQQPKLLRALQERKIQRVGSHNEISVNFRTISASHVNLQEAISNKSFREDLYYRLTKAVIKVPPLKERLEDIPELVQYFLSLSKVKPARIFTPEALGLLQSYHWPGNIRQLQAIVDNIVSRSETEIIREKEVCQALPDVASLYTNAFGVGLTNRYAAHLLMEEKKKFETAIINSKGDRSRAAQSLGLSRSTFFRRATELGLVKKRPLGKRKPKAQEQIYEQQLNH